MRISKERKDQLGTYAQVAVSTDTLVAIIDLVESFNEEQNQQTTFEEMLHGIRRFIATTPQRDMRVKLGIYHDTYIFDADLTPNQVEQLVERFESGECLCGCGEHHDDYDIENLRESITNRTAEKLAVLTEVAELAASDSKSLPFLIGLTAEIAAALYGVLNFQELADILAHYHPTLSISKEDILPALTNQINELGAENVDYTVFEGFIVAPIILPDAINISSEEVELIDIIRAEQKSRKRYIPDYEAFVQCAIPIYEALSDQVSDFIAFLEKNQRRLNVTEVEIAHTVSTFLQLLKAGLEPKYFIEFFAEEGFSFGGTKFVSEFMGYAVEIYNNTRMYELNGNTPNELATQAATPMLRLVPKVGRNELCPCGSGKKHKKCCLE